MPQVVGWEPNERGKPGARLADLSASMNSKLVMAQAVDLNLRLMRWRMWPSLDTVEPPCNPLVAPSTPSAPSTTSTTSTTDVAHARPYLHSSISQ